MSSTPPTAVEAAALRRQVVSTLDGRRSVLAQQVVDHRRRLQSAATHHGPGVVAEPLRQVESHLLYLAEAIATGQLALFEDYIAWTKTLWAARGIPTQELANQLASMAEILFQQLPAEARALPLAYVTAARQSLDAVPLEPAPFLADDQPLAELANGYLQTLLQGRRVQASRAILEAVQQGTRVRHIYLHVFQPVQYEIGRLWQLNRISVAHEHYCSAATQFIMAQLYPYVLHERRGGRQMIAACIADELHEIGARMVADFFEMDGWDTLYLGANVPNACLIRLVAERRADLLAVSATITHHVRAVGELIAALRGDSRCRHVKVLVGGHPFRVAPALWRELGADGSAADAAQAVALAAALLPPRP